VDLIGERSVPALLFRIIVVGKGREGTGHPAIVANVPCGTFLPGNLTARNLLILGVTIFRGNGISGLRDAAMPIFVGGGCLRKWT
jgi:hypothetical protein